MTEPIATDIPAVVGATPDQPPGKHDAEVERLFGVGDTVQVISGPLKGLEGIYQAHDGEMRAMILVELLGQPQKLRMALDTLNKIEA